MQSSQWFLYSRITQYKLKIVVSFQQLSKKNCFFMMPVEIHKNTMWENISHLPWIRL